MAKSMAHTTRCSPTDWRRLRQPRKDSHKGDNGRLLICAGSRRYHGSLILAIRAAVRFCDLVYVYSLGNEALVLKLKSSSPNIIVLRSTRELASFLPRIDAILAGPGWEASPVNRRLLSLLIKTQKPIVLDAGAFDMLDKHRLHEDMLLTPHRGEFKRLFGVEANEKTVRLAAEKTGSVILCKGEVDYIASPLSFKLNTTHHVGMTKGGSGDTLAGLCAALMADHNAPFSAACASAYLLGACGVRLAKRMGAHYSSEDLVEELPKTAYALERKV